ncbi:MAG: helix-turn-helix domain-containing protein [Saprospiraceae bacterium]|uniref:helix-turn-helix domain-containing protein n=1 Tax=Candidatus Brachybacter algidus TaxID=2982024 RepID=UPI00257BC03B|nr:helix-turn-helix domain-containing protein [Candidatus Brachybacter algidus]MBK7605470.1 helix-turn-helix domain-containing protein [Candidatus Brachybacter algidus]
MSSNIKIPKFCQYCGQAFVAQTTTTRFCGHKCASRAYKQRKREEKVQTTLSDQIKSVTSANSENLQSLQSLPIKTGNFLNLRDKEFLSVQETAILLGASRWTIQRMIQRAELKAGKLGRRTIIPRSEIDNLFN